MVEEEVLSNRKIYITLNVLIFICIIIGIFRLENHIVKQTKINKYNDSLYKDMYYSIIDSNEKESYLVTATTYNPTIHQCDSSPDRTACNNKIDLKNPYKHRYIGLSRDLAAEFYCGEKVQLINCGKFSGYYTIADLGNKRLVRTIDILIGKEIGGKFKNVIIRHVN